MTRATLLGIAQANSSEFQAQHAGVSSTSTRIHPRLALANKDVRRGNIGAQTHPRLGHLEFGSIAVVLKYGYRLVRDDAYQGPLGS